MNVRSEIATALLISMNGEMAVDTVFVVVNAPSLNGAPAIVRALLIESADNSAG